MISILAENAGKTFAELEKRMVNRGLSYVDGVFGTGVGFCFGKEGRGGVHSQAGPRISDGPSGGPSFYFPDLRNYFYFKISPNPSRWVAGKTPRLVSEF